MYCSMLTRYTMKQISAPQRVYYTLLVPPMGSHVSGGRCMYMYLHFTWHIHSYGMKSVLGHYAIS